MKGGVEGMQHSGGVGTVAVLSEWRASKGYQRDCLPPEEENSDSEPATSMLRVSETGRARYPG